MTRLLMMICAVSALAAVAGADAQLLPTPPGASRFDPPLPQPPPPPKITIPVVPKFDELPNRNYLPAAPRASFGERIQACLDAAAAAGIKPSHRAAYSRRCATR